jgi:uncharacterized protein YpiB (UPF0302 family)
MTETNNLEKAKTLLLDLKDQKQKIEGRILEGENYCKNLENKIYYKRLEEIQKNLGSELIERLTLKFLKRMEFENIDYGQIVSVGACGKRPYGNSSIENDIVEFFKSEKKLTDESFVVDDYLSNKGWDLYNIIKHKIPYLLNKIILNY